MVQSRIPGLTFTSLRHKVEPIVDDTFRNIYDNLIYIRSRLLPEPIAPVSGLTIQKLTTKPTVSTTTPVMVDTHLVRVTAYRSALPVSGTTYYEFDRNAFYIVSRNLAGVTDWRLIVAVMEDILANRPTDLGVADNGFIFLDVPTHKFYVWDSPNWYELRAEAVFRQGTYATRPAVAATDNGLVYYATDQDVYYQVVAGAWKYMCGVMRGTLSPDLKPALVAGDAGFLFYSTDFDHVFRWSGAAWALAPGEDRIGEIRFFDGVVAPGTGWQLCDGTVTNRSTPTGGTAAVTVPNYTTPAYVKAGIAAVIGPTAASGTVAAVSAGTPSGTVSQPTFTGNALGTHQHDAISAGTPSGTVSQPTFTGNALGTHQHETPFAITASGFGWIVPPPYGYGENQTDTQYALKTGDESTSYAMPMTKAYSAGTPTGTVSQPTFTGSALATHQHAAVSAGTPTGIVSQPTFSGTPLATHDHGPGTLELRNTQLQAFYRL